MKYLSGVILIAGIVMLISALLIPGDQRLMSAVGGTLIGSGGGQLFFEWAKR